MLGRVVGRKKTEPRAALTLIGVEHGIAQVAVVGQRVQLTSAAHCSFRWVSSSN